MTAIVTIAACSDVSECIEPTGEGSARTAELRFNCDIESFDVQTRATTASWDDGAKVYIQFLGNSRVAGYATYKKSTGVWTLYFDESITQGQTATCEVYYFENPASSGTSTVTLSAESAVYADKAATYLYKNGVVTLQGHLKPQTGRVRFKGTAGYTFMLKGLKWYSVYNASSGSLSQTSGQMGLTIGSNGYTQYVYATYDNSSTRQLTVSTAFQGSYDKNFGSNVLAAGKSGYINVPTLDNRYGWTLTGTSQEGLYCPDSNHPHAIDLGIGIKFACCNVGADSPTDYGNYYAWGETSTKSQYDWSTYKWCNGTQNSMTKYCTSSFYGTVDNKTTLELSDDAARANWGGSWRMPTYAELNKLNTDCTWTWTTVNNINGYRVTGSNGNSIFLPAGTCWSSSLSYHDDANYLSFHSDGNGIGVDGGRYRGRSVRPVFDIPTGLVRIRNRRNTTAYLTTNSAGSAIATNKVNKTGDLTQVWIIDLAIDGYTIRSGNTGYYLNSKWSVPTSQLTIVYIQDSPNAEGFYNFSYNRDFSGESCMNKTNSGTGITSWTYAGDSGSDWAIEAAYDIDEDDVLTNLGDY